MWTILYIFCIYIYIYINSCCKKNKRVNYIYHYTQCQFNNMYLGDYY